MPLGRQILSGKPRVSAGQRDKRVTIEQAPAETPGGGYPVDDWTALATVQMSRMDVRADERFMAGQESAFVETTWHMDYRPDMDPELIDVPKTRRLKYENRVYNIRAAAVVGRKHGLEFLTLAATR